MLLDVLHLREVKLQLLLSDRLTLLLGLITSHLSDNLNLLSNACSGCPGSLILTVPRGVLLPLDLLLLLLLLNESLIILSEHLLLLSQVPLISYLVSDLMLYLFQLPPLGTELLLDFDGDALFLNSSQLLIFVVQIVKHHTDSLIHNHIIF